MHDEISRMLISDRIRIQNCITFGDVRSTPRKFLLSANVTFPHVREPCCHFRILIRISYFCRLAQYPSLWKGEDIDFTDAAQLVENKFDGSEKTVLMTMAARNGSDHLQAGCLKGRSDENGDDSPLNLKLGQTPSCLPMD